MLIVVFLPFIFFVGLGVLVFLGRPVLFVQERAGFEGRLFSLYKFRTMRDADPQRGLIDDEQRLGRFGRRLRALSLDELPQLFNVLLGDMSLVGPRPLLPEYIPLYNDRQASRHLVRPGITGLAQINGRNAISWQKKLELDAQYVERRSLGLDIYILYQTALVVISRKGINAQGSATNKKFSGN